MRRDASGMPTRSIISIERRRASTRVLCSCCSSTSPSCVPMRRYGLSDVIGSWKIIEMRLPRIRRMSLSATLKRSCPPNSTVPPVMRPGGSRIKRRIDRFVTLLPLPLSPTMPSVRPGSTSNDTPSTAATTPPSVRNSVRRSRTRRIASPITSSLARASTLSLARPSTSSFMPEMRIERVAQSVAEEIETEKGKGEGQTRKDEHPREERHDGGALVDERAPARLWRLHAEPEERQEGFLQHDGRHGQRRVDDDGAERVRNEMPEDDVSRA